MLDLFEKKSFGYRSLFLCMGESRYNPSLSILSYAHLRGANEYMLDEMDRSLHDCLCVLKRMIESNSLVAGGGAVETALNIHLNGLASSLGSKEQMAVAEFANALLVIPRTLSVNAAQDATELVAVLRAKHNASQVNNCHYSHFISQTFFHSLYISIYSYFPIICRESRARRTCASWA